MKEIQSGQFYKHYKGDTYKVLTVARHSETQELLVIYERQTDIANTGERIWARPLSMFIESIETASYKGPRFTYIQG